MAGLPYSQIQSTRVMGGEHFSSLDPLTIAPSPLGLYVQETWRKFALAAFLADLICYPLPADQVDFPRLLYVMHAFPAGFKVGWVQTLDGQWWPAGYVAWYPMLKTVFDCLEQSPEKQKNRMIVPDVDNQGIGKGSFRYLFNYSVAESFKKTALSRDLIKNYAATVQAGSPAGLSTICVSEEGISVARKFGMTLCGRLSSTDPMNPGDQVYAIRF